MREIITFPPACVHFRRERDKKKRKDEFSIFLLFLPFFFSITTGDVISRSASHSHWSGATGRRYDETGPNKSSTPSRWTFHFFPYSRLLNWREMMLCVFFNSVRDLSGAEDSTANSVQRNKGPV